MSIFDGYSGFDSTDWLREKSLVTLKIAASMVDLANETDTTPWYAKNLKGIANGLIARLGPMVALFYGLGQECAAEEGWQDIGERGTFALVKCCKKWKIKNPYKFLNNLTPKERTDDEVSEKSQEIKEGYRLLYEKGLIEKIDCANLREDDIALKLVVEGMNDSKHPKPYNENEMFGHPGIRIGGEFTTGNIFTITFDGKLKKALSWLSGESKKLDELKLFLQNEIDKNKVYIENIEVQIKDQEKEHDKEKDKTQIQYLTVQVYYPIDVSDSFIESEIKKLAEKWVKQCGFTVSN